MNDPTPLDDLIADDLLLDRLAGRQSAGDEPVAALLRAVAAHADRPLTGRARRRRPHGRRLFAAFAVITVGASGAGVAAAVTLPNYLPGAAERARVERMMDANAASNRPSVLLSRLGIPDDADLGAERGLVLVRRADGRIVLVPAAAVGRPGELSGAAIGLVARDLAGLTGTPQVPGSPGKGSGATGGSGADGATVRGSAGATDAPAEQTATQDDGALVADVKKPVANNGKTGKGQGKDRTTTVTATPPPPPAPPPTPIETPTETQALIAPDSTLGDTSRKKNRSGQGDTSDESDDADSADEPAASGQLDQSRVSGQQASQAPSEQPAPSAPPKKPAPSEQSEQPEKHGTTESDTAKPAESDESGESEHSDHSDHSERSGETSTGPSASAEAAAQATTHAAEPTTARP